jgi:acetate kinase
VTDAVLVLNAGSSSLKYRVVAPGGNPLVSGTVERVDETGWDDAFARLAGELAEAEVGEKDLLGVGHRVVHGGARFTAPTVVDDDVVAGIEALVPLAPLHNPPALAGIHATRARFPGLPQVAVFDTAFFADLPAASATYALDRELADRQQIRRYGMHGISHQYVAGETARFLGRPPAELRLVVLHLGNGASASAISGGRPVDTSMGLTPLEGLVMGTRGGDVDPGVLLHLLRSGHSVGELEDLLHHRSGLQGLAGRHDFRDLLAAMDGGDEAARAAYDVYCHRLRKYVGAYLAVLGGADAVVFTAGVGQHVPRVREDALAGLSALGIDVDPELNRIDTQGARSISAKGSPVLVLVVPTDEELAIARQVRALLGARRATGPDGVR